MLEEIEKKPRYAENFLFAILGMLSSIVICLGTFGVVDNRAPASIEAPAQESDFDARVYFYP